MFKKIAIATATAALFSIGQSATAGQTSNTLNVTANVAANCLVTTAPVDYSGSYDPVSTNAVANLDFGASIAFRCTKSSGGVTSGVSNGANYSSGRRLADTGAANFLNYELYQPAAVGSGASCAYTQAYGTAGAGLFGYSDALQLRSDKAIHALLLFVAVALALTAVWLVFRRRRYFGPAVAVASGLVYWWYSVTDKVPNEFITITPYLVTLLVLGLAAQRLRPPAADGRPYRKGQAT